MSHCRRRAAYRYRIDDARTLIGGVGFGRTLADAKAAAARQVESGLLVRGGYRIVDTHAEEATEETPAGRS